MRKYYFLMILLICISLSGVINESSRYGSNAQSKPLTQSTNKLNTLETEEGKSSQIAENNSDKDKDIENHEEIIAIPINESQVIGESLKNLKLKQLELDAVNLRFTISVMQGYEAAGLKTKDVKELVLLENGNYGAKVIKTGIGKDTGKKISTGSGKPVEKSGK